ncbi:MAG: hypothetical protein ABFD50_04610 [Smithella sp.]
MNCSTVHRPRNLKCCAENRVRSFYKNNKRVPSYHELHDEITREHNHDCSKEYSNNYYYSNVLFSAINNLENRLAIQKRKEFYTHLQTLVSLHNRIFEASGWKYLIHGVDENYNGIYVYIKYCSNEPCPLSKNSFHTYGCVNCEADLYREMSSILKRLLDEYLAVEKNLFTRSA